MAGLWQNPPQQLSIATTEVDIWRIELVMEQDGIESCRQLLSPDEIKRADRFHFPRDQRSFAISHAALRTILSNYLAISPQQLNPQQLEFATNDFNKPFLKNDESGLQFNLSHSHQLALVAVTRDSEIGVDVEKIREDVSSEQIASRFFSAEEVKQLQSTPQDLRKKAFFLGWTRKEAYIKAREKGLSIPLDSFQVSLIPGEAVSLLPEREQRQHPWQLRDISIDVGYAAAFVLKGEVAHVRYWQWHLSWVESVVKFSVKAVDPQA